MPNHNKVHRFYIAQQPHQEPGEMFVFHARKPLALFRVRRSVNNALATTVKVFDECSEEELHMIRIKAQEWYWFSIVNPKTERE